MKKTLRTLIVTLLSVGMLAFAASAGTAVSALHDDFTDENATLHENWSLFADVRDGSRPAIINEDISVSNGHMIIDARGADVINVVAQTFDEWSGNYEVEVRMRIDDVGGGDNHLGVRLSDGSPESRSVFHRPGLPMIRTWMPGTDEAGVGPDVYMLPGEWHNLRIRVRDDLVTIWFDDELLGSVRGLAEQGKISFYAQGNVALFDYIRIDPLDD